MSDGLLMMNELNALSERLKQAVRLLAKYGKEYAQAESEYKVKLAEEALKLRDEGMPVTLIDKVVYGNVANEKFKKRTAEVMYKAAQENINSLKLQIKILDNQISREWGRGGD